MIGSVRALGRRLWKDRVAYLFLLPGYSAFLITVFIPLLAGIYISLLRTDYITFAWVGLGNYRTLLSDPVFLKSLVNTLTYVLILVPIPVGLSLLIALLIHPLPAWMQSFFRGAFYLPGVVGGIVLTTVWLWIFNPTFGLMNYALGWLGIKPILWLGSARYSKIAVCIAVLFQVLGSQIILFMAGLENIPQEIRDAALVDGANRWQLARRIIFPLLRPVLSFVITIQTINTFQIWETIYLLTNGGPNDSSASVVFGIYQTSFQFSKWGLGAAESVVLMIIIIAVSLLQWRYYWRSAET